MTTQLRRWSAVCALVTLVGCQSAPPDVKTEERIDEAVAVAEPVRFQTKGEPIDVGEASPELLTLADAVGRTIRHDPGLQASLARVRAALADAQQARLLPNPVLDIALEFPEGGGQPIVEASIAADIIAILKIPRRTSAADRQLRAASAEALTVALDLLADVQERYATIQSLDAQLLALSEQRDLLQRLIDLAKARVNAGEDSPLDTLSFESQRVTVEAEIIQRGADAANERLRLSRLMGEPSGPIVWRVAPWRAPDPIPIDRAAWISFALHHRPEIQARMWELAALGDELALTGFAPWDGTEVGGSSERDPTWSVGPEVIVPIPLFDWGQARRAKATAEQIEGRHRLVESQRMVVEDVRRANESLEAAKRALAKVQDELIPIQSQRFTRAHAQYENGLADVTTVMLADQDLKSAQITRIELQQRVSLAQVRLKRALGGPGSRQ